MTDLKEVSDISFRKDGRIQWLDVFRGFAILLVLLFHFTIRYGEKYPMNAFKDSALLQIKFGWIGVYLFFMISGFIIYLTIQNKKGPVDFLIARLSRLMPPYWSAILLILILEYVHAALFHVPLRNELVTILLNIVMVPDIFHSRFLDGAFWSLFVEIKFYILFALLWRLVNMREEKVFFISYAMLLILAMIHNYLYSFPLGDNFNYFLVFWLGIASYKTLKEKLALWKYVILTMITSLSTIGFYRDGVDLLIGIPVFSALFLVTEEFFKKHPNVGYLFLPVSFLGRISYSCYLVHQPIGYLVLGFSSLFLLSYNVAILFALLFCFGIAWLGFRFIERLDKSIANTVSRKIGHLDKKIEIYPSN